MDGIDIVDTAFSLSNSTVPSIVDGTTGGIQWWVYASIALAVIIGYVVWKKYIKARRDDDVVEDCPGGFCNMGDAPSHSISSHPSVRRAEEPEGTPIDLLHE